MKKLVVGTFLTLDGVMQAPGDPHEDIEGEFKLAGWQWPYFDEEAGRILGETIAGTDALLLGRVTYQIFAASWPFAPKDDPIAARLNSIPKYVVSTTLNKVEWNNSTLIKANIPEEVVKLKQKPGSGVLSVTGSGKLLRTLMKYDLVDEYVLWIHPLLLGGGKRLFEEGIAPANLKLLSARTTPRGVVILTYRPD